MPEEWQSANKYNCMFPLMNAAGVGAKVRIGDTCAVHEQLQIYDKVERTAQWHGCFTQVPLVTSSCSCQCLSCLQHSLGQPVASTCC